MSKRFIVRVLVGRKQYRLNKNDIKYTHHVKKRPIPPVPSFFKTVKKPISDVENTSFYSMAFTKEESAYEEDSLEYEAD